MERELVLPPGEISSWNDDEYVLDYCPFCNNENKFVYNIEKTVGRCWTCPKTVTSYKGLLAAVNNPNSLEEVSFFKAPIKHSKASANFLGNAWDHPRSRDFLISRGVGELISRLYNILYDAKGNTAYIEVKSISADLPSSVLWRQLSPTGKWFFRKGTKANYYAWNWEPFINYGRSILVTEGIFDLISTGLEYQGIALLGSHPNYVKFYWLKKNVSKVVVWMDADPAGYEANEYIAKNCEYFQIPYEVVLAKKDPKKFNRKIKSDRLFLEEVERRLNL